MGTLFWALSIEDRVKLMEYQFEEYGEVLKVPKEPKQEPIEIPVDTDMELEEIGKFMRQAPSRRRDNET